MRRTPVLVLAAAGALTAGSSAFGAAPGLYGYPSPSPAPTAMPHAHRAGGARVVVRRTKLGRLLVDGSGGRTLYRFGRDHGKRSRCNGACAANWPALTTRGRPRAGHGAKAALLGTSRRRDGSRQVTYHGHPLYMFAGDRRSGDTNGQGIHAFGGTWTAVTPHGGRVRNG